jgi:protein ImuB
LEAWVVTLQPDQRSQPLALMAGTRVAACNDEASRCGLQVGMKRATALALAPQLIRGQADPTREAEALRALAYAALQFTPAVTLYDSATVLLEVSTTQRAMGGLQRLVEELQSSIATWGFTRRLVIAPTAGGAALLARWHGADIHLKGECQLSLRDLKNIVLHAPLILLKAAAQSWSQLQLMGLSSIGDVQALPRDGLNRRLGPQLMSELDALYGDVPQAHAWVTLPEHFEARLELYARADTTQQVLCGANILMERLLAWARARRGRVSRLQLHMVHEHRHRRDDNIPDSTVLEWALAEPSNDLAHLSMLLRERLVHAPLPAPTTELRIRCAELVLSEAPSGELFPTRASEQQGLSRLVERLQARLGRDAVRSLEVVHDHRPERSTRCEPLNAAELVHDTTRSARRRSKTSTTVNMTVDTPSPVLPMVRPVWLLTHPQALPVHRSAPCLEGQPLRLLAGPERIEAGWWDGLTARDYFVAQAHDQSLVWIYRRRLPLEGLETESLDAAHASADSGWYLHGRFA